jgi:hypothetical protein
VGRGGLTSITSSEHEEYDTSGQLVVRFESFDETVRTGEHVGDWRRFSPQGELIAERSLGCAAGQDSVTHNPKSLSLFPSETGPMKPTIKRKLDLTKVRTRYEPPTLEEAIFAAEGLSGDLDHQVAIAAELTGKPASEVQAAVLKTRSPDRQVLVRAAQRAPIIVERRSLRSTATR